MTYVQPDLLQRVERLELRAQRIVEGWLVGRQASPYLGSATEFASHRPYATGDEPRHLDWKVYARTRRLVVKQFREETHLPCWIVVVASGSMRYGEAAGWSKYDHAATLAVSLAHLLTRQQDVAGLLAVGAGETRTVAPRAHPRQVSRLAEELERLRPGGASQLAAVVRRSASSWQRRGLVVVVGDFLEEPTELAEVLRELRGRRQEMLVCQVLHGDELTFPFEGTTLFRGLETADEVEADPRAFRASYLAALETFLAESRQTCVRAGADYLRVDMREPLAAVLAAYLGFRHGRR